VDKTRVIQFQMPYLSASITRRAPPRLAAFCTAIGLVVAMACQSNGTLRPAERQAIIDSLTRQVKAAYDLSKPNPEQRLLSLYPDTGRVVSAAGGSIVANRDSVAQGIKYFWENVGVHMRQPRWIWDQMMFDVLSPTAAVMTATYHVPHITPSGMPHVIGGAWTAVFQKRGGRWYVIQEHLSDWPAPPPADSASMKMPAAH
jgi:hypothetical protein